MGKTRTEKQVKLFFIILIIILFLTLLIFWIFDNINKFKILGITFQKIKFDKLSLFYSKMMIIRDDKTKINYNLYLRNDPRILKNVKADVDVKFKKGFITFISFSPDMENCDNNTVALYNLADFINAMGIPIKSGVTFINESIVGIPLANCNTHPENTVITIQNRNETFIEQKENCYIINFKDCEILMGTERFILETIADSKNQFI